MPVLKIMGQPAVDRGSTRCRSWVDPGSWELCSPLASLLAISPVAFELFGHHHFATSAIFSSAMVHRVAFALPCAVTLKGRRLGPHHYLRCWLEVDVARLRCFRLQRSNRLGLDLRLDLLLLRRVFRNWVFQKRPGIQRRAQTLSVPQERLHRQCGCVDGVELILAWAKIATDTPYTNQIK